MARIEQVNEVIHVRVGAVSNYVILLLVVLTLGLSNEVESYGENPSAVKSPMDATEIREKALPSVVLITNLNSKRHGAFYTGSGVLVNRRMGLILTNAHVTAKNPTVDVVFPTYNFRGEIIRDQDFYTTDISDLFRSERRSNYSVLKRQGIIAEGRVIIEHEDSDLALISVRGVLPKTATQIDYDSNYDYKRLKNSSPIHILGHPNNKRELLWQWIGGHYHSVKGDTLILNAAVWRGNSGGPVTDGNGKLIGLVKQMHKRKDEMSYAVSIPAIAKMEGEIKSWYVFWIENHTASNLHYETKWFGAKEWKQDTLEPGHWLPYVIEVDNYHNANPQGGHSRIRYKIIGQAKKEVDSAESVPTEDTDDVERFVEYELTAKRHVFGDDVRDRIKRFNDGTVYKFGIKDVGKNGEPELKLYQRRSMFWIANHTKHSIQYTLQWEPGEANEDNFFLNPGKIRPHFPSNSSSGTFFQTRLYPRIGYSGIEKPIFSRYIKPAFEMLSYFDMEFMEQEEFVLNAQHQPHPFDNWSYEFFHFTTNNSDETILNEGLHPPPPSPNWLESNKWRMWLGIFIVLAFISATKIKKNYRKIKLYILGKF